MGTQTSYLRHPHVRGDLVTFIACDDVWLGSVDRGLAWRLTADGVAASKPRISPDGQTVAWTSTRAGIPEVFAVETAGGPPRRLTYFGHPTTTVDNFLPDGRLVVTSAGSRPFRANFWAYAIDVSPDADAAPRPLPYGPVNAVAASALTAAVVLGTGYQRDPAHWKRYRGGTAGRLWIDPDGVGQFNELLAEVAGPKVNPTWVGDRLAFIADFEAHGNVYSVRVDERGIAGDLRRHSDHSTYYARQLCGDGRRLVYSHAGELWTVENLEPQATPRRLELATPGVRGGRACAELDVADNLGELAVDATGRTSGVEVRGNVVWLAHSAGPATAVAAEPGVRHRCPVLLSSDPDRPRFAYITDAEGADAIEINTLGQEVRRVGAGQVGRVLELCASPDGHRLAVACHDGRLLHVDVDSGEIRELARSANGEPSGLVFSPDSAWLAYSGAKPSQTRSVTLIELATGEALDVTQERFIDTEPAFSLDGSYLYFLSARTFDPVYDAHVFDLSFPLATRPYLVALAAGSRSPFDPQPAGRPVEEPDKDDHGSPSSPAQQDGQAVGAGGEPGPAVPAVVVDRDGLSSRVVPFPVAAGRLANLRAADGGVIWLDDPVVGELGEARQPDDDVRPSLQRWDFRSRKQVELLAHVDAVEVSGDGKRLVVRDKKSLAVYPATRKAEEDSDDIVEVELDRIRLSVDPPAEWAQMLAETGRLMADHFWIEDMGGVDWPSAVAKYRPLIDRIASRDDLSDLLWELNGETGSSHAYESPAPRDIPDRLKPAFLGADVESRPAGGLVVTRILAGDNSARDGRSPLSAPGVGIAVGDVLLAVNGTAIGPGGLGRALQGTANKPIALTYESEGRSRLAVVVPLADDAGLRYLDWVASRRATVHIRTGGRVGYVHLPDMVSNGWAAFHRDLRVEIQRDGLIVDTRYNQGGHTSQLVIEKLARRVIGWDTVRHGPDLAYPEDAPRGPLLSIANEWSGSDGDIVNAAFRELGLGPVFGTRTWGGVVGIDGRYHLLDGTMVTQPRYSFWFRNAGWSVENHGVDPDRVVECRAQDWARGADPQLAAAIDWIVGELTTRPALPRPDLSTRPSLRAGPLPLRPTGGPAVVINPSAPG